MHVSITVSAAFPPPVGSRVSAAQLRNLPPAPAPQARVAHTVGTPPTKEAPETMQTQPAKHETAFNPAEVQYSTLEAIEGLTTAFVTHFTVQRAV